MRFGQALLVLGVAALAVQPLAAANSKKDGSSEENAIVLTAKSNVQTNVFTLVGSGTNGVCFFKMKLTKKKPYTIWLETAPGGSAYISQTYPELGFSFDFDRNPPSADFERVENGSWVGWVMTGEHWERDEGGSWDGDTTGDDISFKVPSSWDYIIVVKGPAGESAKLLYCQGQQIPAGFLKNPLAVKPAGTWQAASDLVFYSPNYYLKTDFEAGRRYYFATAGGVEGNPIALADLPDGDVWDYQEGDADAFNDAKIFIPGANASALYRLTTLLSKTDDFARVTLRYRVDPVRTLAEHMPVALQENVPVAFAPGHLNAWDSGAYDPIIDEGLFKLTAAKGQRYVISASWQNDAQATNLLMRLYDEKGAVLLENKGDGSGLNVRCAIEPQKAKTVFYVGVCQDLGSDDDFVEPRYWPAQIVLTPVDEASAVPEPVALHPAPVSASVRPREGDKDGFWMQGFSSNCWYRTLKVNARKGFTYEIFPALMEGQDLGLGLSAELYRLSGKKEVSLGLFDFSLGSGGVNFQATSTESYYVRVRVTDGLGLDHDRCHLYCIGSAPNDASGNPVQCGRLRVVPKGAEGATWTIDKEKTVYAAGESILLPVGVYTVKYGAVKGYGKPADREAAVYAEEECLVDDGRYSDTYDPKDDFISGKAGSVKYAATSWTLKTSETFQSRTLWENDEADTFTFTAKDGYYYDFRLLDSTCDAVIGIADASGQDVVTGQTEVSHLALGAGKYYLTVSHGTPERSGGSYRLGGFYANVGALKFAKTAVTVKENAASVTLTVNRTAKDGRIVARVRTVDGEHAKGVPSHQVQGEDYKFYSVDTQLVWENGDSKAKTVTIRLIPDLLPVYHDYARTFTVCLEQTALGDYPAAFVAGKATATVTLKESQTKKTVVPAYPQSAAYKAIKAKKVSKDESALVRAGTFFGVLGAEEKALTNGLPEFASVTLTSTAKISTSKGVTTTNDALSAKVALGGKTYTFKSDAKKAPVVWTDLGEGRKQTTLTLVQTVNKVVYTNELTFTLGDWGLSTDGDAGGVSNWLNQRADARLRMNVPDAKGKGVQADIRYGGWLYRDNAKIQEYLSIATNFVGYYTMALVPHGRDLSYPTAVKDGHGYLAVTIDNGGKAKLSGKLADGTSVSLSSVAARIFPDESSSTGYGLTVPVFVAKSPYCLAGELVLTATEDLNGDGRKTVVVDSEKSALFWNSDNLALSEANDRLTACRFEVVGGFFDTVERLQRYYYNCGADAFAVDTVAADEMPDSLFQIGGVAYAPVAIQDADGLAVNLAVDAFSTDKKAVVKDPATKLIDFAASVNPANVQVKIVRATGLVSGSFSVWGEGTNAKGAAVQKEVTGFKHYGILLMNRGNESVGLPPGVLTAGFFNRSLTVPTGVGTKTRKWTYSAPFDIKENNR